MVVGVVAQPVSIAEHRLEPIDVLLFENPADQEAVRDAAFRPHAAAGLGDVLLGRRVEISLGVVPLRHAPTGIVHRHFQVERNGHQRLVVIGGQLATGLGRGGLGSAGKKTIRRGQGCRASSGQELATRKLRGSFHMWHNRPRL